MTTRTFAPEDIERLASKLDALSDQLGQDDRATLEAVFAWAGRGVAPEGEEVSGFAFDTYFTAGGLSQSFAAGAGSSEHIFEISSFSWGAGGQSSGGASSGGGQAGAGDITFVE